MGGRGASSPSAYRSLLGDAIGAMLSARGIKVNRDGTVTLYHTTSQENANKIMRQGFVGNDSPIGGITGEDIDKRSFFGLDKEWVSSTWGRPGDTVLEIKVPAEYIRQGGGNNLEVYIEGVVKPTGKNNVWIPNRTPTSTFYDRLALKRYGRKKAK